MPLGGCVISYDFELAWGSRASSLPLAIDEIERYHRVATEIVPRLLELHDRYQIPATWGVVGQLMLRGDDCPTGHYPYPPSSEAPRYPWFSGNWFDGIPGLESAEADAYYAPRAVQAILDCPVRQELASHGFSHAPLGDPACSAAFARWELAASRAVSARWGRPPTSLIFPRNEVGHLPLLRELGFRAFRGANSEWYWFGRANQLHRRRTLRYGVWVLRYFDEWSAHTPPLPAARNHEGVWEIPHSMFIPGLRGVSRFIAPEQRVRRAVRGLQAAADEGKLFSLWTHPHNFLPGAERLLPAWEEIFRSAAELREQGRLQVLTMEQLVAALDSGARPAWLAE